MKLYLVSQTENNDYDTYSDAVVAAPSRAEARQMNPADGKKINWVKSDGSWASSPEKVKTKLLGVARAGISKGVICHSFHAG